MPDHSGEVSFLFPREKRRKKFLARTDLSRDEILHKHVRYTGITYPEMSRNEEKNINNESFFWKSYSDKFHPASSRALFNFLYDHNDGWSFQPEVTKLLLAGTGKIDRDRIVVIPPSFESSTVDNAKSGVLRDVLSIKWTDNDKQFKNDDIYIQQLVNDSEQNKTMEGTIMDFLNSGDPVFTRWMMGSRVDFKTLGDKLADIVLDVEREGDGNRAEKYADMILKDRNALNYTGLLDARTPEIKDLAVQSIMSSFMDIYEDKESTPSTLKKMTRVMSGLIDHHASGVLIQTRFKRSKLNRLRTTNKKLYCDFMESLSNDLNIRQHPFRFDVQAIHVEKCTR